MYGPGEAATRDRLQDELVLIGHEVKSRAGARRDAEMARDENENRAIVFLNQEGALIWVTPEDEPASGVPPPTAVERSSEESSELLALRLAELLRGRLLPSDRHSQEKAPARDRDDTVTGFRRRFSVSTGPSLLVRNYAGATLGWTGDVAVWVRRFGFGAYATAALFPGDWRATADEFTFRQANFGFQGRFAPYQSANQELEIQAIARLGLMPITLVDGPGPANQQLEGSALFLSGEAGAEATLAVTSWLRLGGQLMGGFAGALDWTIAPVNELPEPAAVERGSAGAPPVQGHLAASVVGVVHF